jgi:hypothetical protein
VGKPLFPNRTLREAGLLTLREEGGCEHLVPEESMAWAMVDHQVAHVFVREERDVERVADLFRQGGAEEVLIGPERARHGLDHPRSGEIVLIAPPDRWFAYYWWLDDEKAPPFARTVDIHRKPGYDPVEMFINLPERTTPLDASLVKGSHGYPADDASRRGVLLSSEANALAAKNSFRDKDVASIVLNNFGVVFGMAGR